MPPVLITGLLLAGGAGRRMGGIDKGLQLLNGKPLAVHVLERLEPQVGSVLISANRHLDRYAAFGHPVRVDDDQFEGRFEGPLAGMLAGLQACRTDWLQCVPCDTPHLPLDLCQRLAAHLPPGMPGAPGVTAAWPRTLDAGGWRSQPACALLHRSLLPSLQRYLVAGERRVDGWLRTLQHVEVDFDRPGDAATFVNLNSLSDLPP